MVLVQIQYFWTGTRYGFEILYQCGKKVKTKNYQRVLAVDFNVCRCYRGKTGRRWGLFVLKMSYKVCFSMNIIAIIMSILDCNKYKGIFFSNAMKNCA